MLFTILTIVYMYPVAFCGLLYYFILFFFFYENYVFYPNIIDTHHDLCQIKSHTCRIV